MLVKDINRASAALLFISVELEHLEKTPGCISRHINPQILQYL